MASIASESPTTAVVTPAVDVATTSVDLSIASPGVTQAAGGDPQATPTFTSVQEAEAALFKAVDEKEAGWHEVVYAHQQMKLSFEYVEEVLEQYKEQSRRLSEVVSAVARFATAGDHIPN